MFTLEYRSDWSSIESTFISDARFLSSYEPAPKWQPNWYCGTRTEYVYPPLLRYGTMLAAKATGWSEVRAYHFYTSLLFAFGIAGVYLFVRIGSGSRAGAWLAALGTLLVSPSLLCIEDFRADAATREFMPVRLGVLLIYGEGPHMSSLALLPPALAAAWVSFRKSCHAALGISAALCALVVGHNFYGATALAIFFPLLVWAVWVTTGDWRIWWRAVGIAALAYGLSAWWLTPSYLSITRRNLSLVAQPGNLWSAAVAIGAAIAFGLVTWKWLRGRREAAWTVFTVGLAVFWSLNVIGHYHFGFRVAGEPLRLVPELDLALILVAVEALRRIWGAKPMRKLAVMALVAAAFYPSLSFVRRAWTFYEADPDFRSRVEYRIPQWVKENMPGARALTTGSVRFWYNAWDDLPQVGGGSEQGLLNLHALWAQLEAVSGIDYELALAWLRAVGADAVVVHDQRSQEAYHDYPRPEKFEPMGPPVFDDGQGNFIYRVPRSSPGIAHVVSLQEMRGLKPPESPVDHVNVKAYAAAVEKGRATKLTRSHPDRMTVRASFGSGEGLLVQETFDKPWRARLDGRQLPIERDAMGFMLVPAPEGEHEIQLEFTTPLENQLGRTLSLFSAAMAGWLLWRTIRKRT